MKSDLELAIRAAVQAGKAIGGIYTEEDFGVQSKADDTPLTIADKRAHEIIKERLKETGIPVLSEEGRHIPYEERKQWSRLWLVDPLDGTKEFIKRNDEFTVNIALVENGRSVFGVVFAPVLDELYVGIPGRGSFLCRKEKYFTQPLDYLVQFSERLPGEHPGENTFRVVASRSHYNEETASYVNSLGSGGRELSLVSRGSSLKLCMVASGEAEIYPRLGPTMEWDTAAAHAVVKASGKNVFRIDNGQELEYNKENLLNPFFVVR